MKPLHCIACMSLVFCLLAASQANGAIDITTTNFLVTSDSTANLSAAEVTALVNSVLDPDCPSLTEVYKQNAGDSNDTGSFAGSYNTIYSTDNETAQIVYVPDTPILQCDCLFLLVKNGNQQPAQYIYDLNALGWNGTDTINITQLWPEQGSISHVSIYCDEPREVPPPVIPEPATMLAWALGFVGIGAVGYRRRRVSG